MRIICCPSCFESTDPTDPLGVAVGPSRRVSREPALGYLDALVLDTARYRQLTRAERERYWR